MEKCAGKVFVLNRDIVACEQFDAELFANATTIYEVIRVIHGRYLFLEEHLERLQKSARVANILLWYNNMEIALAMNWLQEKNDIIDGNIKLAFLVSGESKVFMAYRIPASYPGTKLYQQGVETKLINAERVNPNVKIFNPSLRERVDCFILNEGIYEALLVNRDGFITEGNKSNVFFVKNDEVITAPLEWVLPGITRTHVVNICQRLQIPLKQKLVHTSELEKFGAVFLSGTSPKVIPVRNIDQQIYFAQNPVVQQIMQEFNQEIDRYVFG